MRKLSSAELCCPHTAQWLRLPALLRFDIATSATSVNAILAAFSHHEPLAKLTLFFDGTLPAQVSFAPLQSLPALKTLRLKATLSSAQVQEMRSLTQLERLDGSFSERTLLQMLQPPHQLRWTELPKGSRECVTPAVAALLPFLLHLRTFCLPACHPSLSSLDFLAHLPALTEMRKESIDPDALLETLSVALPQVRKLSIDCSYINIDQLQALLTHFTRLRELTFEIARFNSLSFLSPVRGTLRSLSLAMCNRIGFTANSLQLLRPFHLTSLQINRRYGTALADSLVQSLTPPSTLLPTLE